MYQYADGVKKNYTMAIKLYKQTCNGGEAVGCYNLGAMHYNGQGLKRNKSLAIALFKKACDNGSQDGCKYYKMLNNPIKNKKLSLVKENYAKISFNKIKYILNSYIVMFENPYYITIEREDKGAITYEEAINISIDYIKPRGCSSPLKRLPNLDKSNNEKTKWMIGISC